jgi:Fe-S cluster assembly iron-binding protein IscA
MKITVTDGALKEIKSIAEKQKMTKPVVYLDLVRSCCSSTPKVDVVDQTSSKLETICNVNGISIAACDPIAEFLKENEEGNDFELKVDLIMPYGLSFQIIKISKIEDA